MNTSSRYTRSSVGTGTWRRAVQSRNRGSIPTRGYISASRSALGPTILFHTQWVGRVWGGGQGVKWTVPFMLCGVYKWIALYLYSPYIPSWRPKGLQAKLPKRRALHLRQCGAYHNRVQLHQTHKYYLLQTSVPGTGWRKARNIPGLSGKYPAILNISRTVGAALM
jgi:hypothetical protein